MQLSSHTFSREEMLVKKMDFQKSSLPCSWLILKRSLCSLLRGRGLLIWSLRGHAKHLTTTQEGCYHAGLCEAAKPKTKPLKHHNFISEAFEYMFYMALLQLTL